MPDILMIVVSAATGTVGAYLGALWGSSQQARRTIYERIHETRMRVYKDAWKITGVLPRRPNMTSLSSAKVFQLGTELHEWYYQEGGMYLSGGSRRAYSWLQDGVEEVRQRGGDAEANISASDYELIRSRASDFRTALTGDLLSRRRPPTGKKWTKRSPDFANGFQGRVTTQTTF
jgi:hypothetical protein